MSIPDELGTAITRLCCEHSFPVQPPNGSLFAPGDCSGCGMPWAYRIEITDRLLEPIAALLYEAARTASNHGTDPAYAGLPDHRWCLGCQNEECDGLQLLDRAFAVARTINGAVPVAATGGVR